MSKSPVIRPISWLNAAISTSVLLGATTVGFFAGGPFGVMVAAGLYILVSQTLRKAIPRNHRRAIKHVRNGDYQLAIPEFERSAKFFAENEWIDRYRSLTLLSSAGMSYREMALTSLAFCHGQIGDGGKARDYYKQCIAENPNNEVARSGLRLMEAASNIHRS